MKHSEKADQGSKTNRMTVLILCLAVAALAAYFLLFQGSVNLNSVFLILLVLSCPLMHLLMHRGHGKH